MRPQNLKISTQLAIGFGLIIALVGALGVLASRQTDQIWLQTRNIYEHPFMTRRALGTLEHDFLNIRIEMLSLLLAENSAAVSTVERQLALRDAEADRMLDALRSSYLGPGADITALQDELNTWRVLRAETIALLRSGKAAQASALIKDGGSTAEQFEHVMRRHGVISEFAITKADQIYSDATALNDSLHRNLLIIVTTILLASLAIAWRLVRAVQVPLVGLTTITEQLRQGKLDARASGSTAAHEFRVLSDAFNAMAETLQMEIRGAAKAARLSDIMLKEEEAHAFCRALLAALLEHTGSQVGAVYVLNDAATAFEHFESIGLSVGAHAAFSATALEGELGAALATRQIQRITDIPPDTRFRFAAVSGDFAPREILTIPVPADHSVSAVISLASIRAYDAASIRLVNDIWSVLTARVNGVLAYRRIQALAARLEHQNDELDVQKRELEVRADQQTLQTFELEMQKRQLDEANRLKSAFLSNMSHELRTPLNSVIALSGVLNRRLKQTIPEEEHGYLDVIERNGKDLLVLINDILDLSRIEAGYEEITLGRVSVREVAGGLMEMLQPLAAERGIALVNLVPDDLPPITSDAHKVKHILQNLVGNAVKFTDSGSVEIAARQDGEHQLVMIRDTGIGIAAGQLAHIFDEFRQVDGSASRRHGGTGLGLAIARKYALLLDGDILVESALGAGSTFTLRLPLALKSQGTAGGTQTAVLSAAAADSRGIRPSPAQSGVGRTILVVDDNEPAAVQLTDILAGQGYHLQLARSGMEALALLEHHLPDAMILDLMMPEMNGFQVLKAIRDVERTARVPVLILTAKHVTKAELRELKSNNIHELIQKGNVNARELLEAVGRMIAPLAEARVALASFTRPRPRKPRAARPLVLVVDDNPDSRLSARALLRDHYDVLEAADGRAGVDLARAQQPDIILMDISMPVLDGVQALQEIRNDASLQHVAVIALTASAMKGERETILAYGFDDYLSKPLDVERLLETLLKALD